MQEQARKYAANNGGSASLSLLSSGVVIPPAGGSTSSDVWSSSIAIAHGSHARSLVSVMYQTLLNLQPPEVPSFEAIDNVGNLFRRVIREIKDAIYINCVTTAL